jgi:hypothetical protein
MLCFILFYVQILNIAFQAEVLGVEAEQRMGMTKKQLEALANEKKMQQMALSELQTQCVPFYLSSVNKLAMLKNFADFVWVGDYSENKDFLDLVSPMLNSSGVFYSNIVMVAIFSNLIYIGIAFVYTIGSASEAAFVAYVEASDRFKILDRFFLTSSRPFVHVAKWSGAPSNVCFLSLVCRTNTGKTIMSFHPHSKCSHNYMSAKLIPGRSFLRLSKVILYLIYLCFSSCALEIVRFMLCLHFAVGETPPRH